MTTLLLASLYALKFEGGTPNDFVNALADATQQNVVMSQGDAKLLPRAEFETKDIDEMSRAIRAQMKHLIYPGSELVLGDQKLAKNLVEDRQQRFRVTQDGMEAEILVRVQESRSRATRTTAPAQPTESLLSVNRIPLLSGALKDGKVTFKTEKADALQLTLLNGGLAKPVRVHWIYHEAPVFMNVKDLPEAEFMRFIAKSVGSRLVSTPKEYYFDLDAVEIRKRAVATIQGEAIPQDDRENADRLLKARNFRIACMNTLSPAQLTAALADSGSSVRVELTNRSPLTRLAVQRVQQIDAERQSRPQPGPPGQAPQGIMQRIDSSRTAILTVDSRFGVRMEIPVLDQNGRPAGVVRL